MAKLSKQMVYGALGAAGGVAGLCAGGGCPACLRCAGLGIVLVAVALLNKRKGGQQDELAQGIN